MQNKVDEKIEELRRELGEIELGVLTKGYSLPDAIREGATVTEQAKGWGDGSESACALTSAYLSVRARGMVE